MSGESKTSPRRIEAVQRQAKALELRLEGKTYAQIAEAVGGYNSPSAARKGVMTALKKTQKGPGNGLPNLEVTQRQAKALQMRLTGQTYAAIADEFEEYNSPAAVYQAVMSALKNMLQAPADEVRKIEAARLDALWLALQPKLEKGELPAIDRALRLMKRRAELLGLDAPTRADVTTGGEPLQIQFVWDDVGDDNSGHN